MWGQATLADPQQALQNNVANSKGSCHGKIPDTFSRKGTRHFDPQEDETNKQ